MKKRIFAALLASLFLGSAAYAQDNENKGSFYVDAQLRTRGEYRHGAIQPRNEGDKPAGFINERARLSLGYQRKRLALGFSAQHVGVWGQDAMVEKSGRLSLNEAWAALCLNDSWFVKLGRQELSYDNERLLGELDWNVAGRYHDALKLGYESMGYKFHAVVAFNQNDESIIGGTYYDNSRTKLYKNMQMLWYNYDFVQIRGCLSLLAMNIGQEGGNAETKKADTKYMQTFGAYLYLYPNRWDVSGSFYYQTGKTPAGRSVSAYMANVAAEYRISRPWSVGVLFDYLSGSKDATGTYRAFNPLYGTHHKFYGAMDYFYASNFANGYAPGLMDADLYVKYRVSPTVSMGLDCHYFATGAKLANLERTLGSELDYQLQWKIMKDVSLSLGYSVMFGTSTMDAVKGGNHNCWQDWGWVSLNITPRLFEKE